ncbi:MAG: hypothetical protein J2P45_01125 [Candidatus Dormibacteraeota bacterium]|nr:hypothetical protein [Candidatus Dormibacteraeota bacterium]
MPAEHLRYTFLPLFAEPHGAEAERLLEAALAPEADGFVRCLRPPVAGLAFLSAGGEVAETLDLWWQTNVPEDGLPVLLMLHEPELETWVPGLDAELVIGVPGGPEQQLYMRFENVLTVVTTDPRTVIDKAVRHYDCFSPLGIPPRLPPPPSASPRKAEEERPQPSTPVSPPPPGDAAPPAPVARSSVVPAELATLALSHQAGRIVAITSRAGGVGKTTVAAGLGIIYGEAVRDSGWHPAVVDQNIGNPDQWGRLGVDPDARTVSEIMADLEAGREWTAPSPTRSPALAVYPERRDLGDGYAPAQIARFAAQLRYLHVMTLVDLPNRMPAFTSAEPAVCAGWIGVADLVLIPTTDDPNHLVGTLEYLDAPLMRGGEDRPPVKVVVPYICSPVRAIREDPQVVGLLEQLRERVLAVVEIPKDENATLALVSGRPVTEVDSGLRDAYIRLALTTARVLLMDRSLI